LVGSQWWLPEAMTVARTDNGRSLQADALVGLSQDELNRWPALAEALGPAASELVNANDDQSHAVLLPQVFADLLKLEVGQHVMINGYRVRFAGTPDSTKLQRLRHLDGESTLPVDFEDELTENENNNQQSDEALLTEDVHRDFVYLGADQVAYCSADFAKLLGAKLHIVTIYPGPGVDTLALGESVAERVVMPIWAAGPEGVYRMLLTYLTEVSGGLQLIVPLGLGGLIIFGTLLGSISDREKEIYTFSALGLSPQHVGVLFFAEAAVYAVVGGMGGQLLAQGVALVAGELANRGLIPPTSINYSSTNSLFAIGVVMATVIVSAIYPAYRASKSANPGLARSWKLPNPRGDELQMTFPFTVSSYDITGVVSFLAEHFRSHDDAGLGKFASTDTRIARDDHGNITLSAELALAPFDLGVTQQLTLTAVPSELKGVEEVQIHAVRLSGSRGDWHRSNKVFVMDLRKQFLLWRTLSSEMIEGYRLNTLQELGPSAKQDAAAAPNVSTQNDEPTPPASGDDL